VNVLVPYVRLHPKTVEALELDWIEATFVNTEGPEAYWETLRDWWVKGETFIVVEQDKIPEPGLLRKLWDCPEAWCSAEAAMRGVEQGSPYPSLSCVKFGQPLMDDYPELLDHVGGLDLGLGAKEWSRLDLGIAGLLGTSWVPHWHEGRVEHLHEEPADAVA
jgi:hypothetical protein